MSDRTILMLIPTRGRPQNMERMWESAYKTAADPENLRLRFYIDEDDFSSQVKLTELSEKYPGKVSGLVSERIMMSDMSNKIDDGVTPTLWLGGDDVVFESNDWDTAVLDEYDKVPDRVLLVYGNDGYNDAKLATHPFLSREWVNTLGYLSPPYFSGEWTDSTLFELASNLGRERYIPIETQHYHYVTGRSVPDQTMIEKNIRAARDNMPQVFMNLLPQRIADFNRVWKLLNPTQSVPPYRTMFP